MLLTKKFYISLLISLLGLVPVLLWNMENNFDSFNFHGNRSSFGFDLIHITNSIFAQLFFLLPTTGFLIITSLMKNKKLQLFGLVMRYVGLFILGVFTLGIWWLWLIPQAYVSFAIFYKELQS